MEDAMKEDGYTAREKTTVPSEEYLGLKRSTTYRQPSCARRPCRQNLRDEHAFAQDDLDGAARAGDDGRTRVDGRAGSCSMVGSWWKMLALM